ncbi:DUF1707 and DUF4190 domain-containing protein [Streptacidiphilus sp. P02-A3a]|nr:DUF1707 and DUF4190 domain-containing protein [Streptacidiphilus sp. P02-A3a]QMU74266.1 DUF1707 and DUF4190 domain-containing protein [Streptacidiphilus sp. P02-A3a]
MRAAHADRERTVDVLKAAFAEGRLTADEYSERVERVYKAQTYGELSGIVQDLPSGPMPLPYLTPSAYLPAAFAPQPYPPVDPYPYPRGYGQPYPGMYPGPYAAPPFGPPARRTNGLAVAALVLGITEFWTLGLTAVPALICGHSARAQIRRQGGEGSGMATAGIVLGWLAVGLWGLVIMLAVLAGSSSGASPGG